MPKTCARGRVLSRKSPLIWLMMMCCGGTLLLPFNRAFGQLPDLVAGYDLALRSLSDPAQYDKGIKACSDVIAGYSKARIDAIGPVFGHFHFIRGILHVRKENWAGGIKDFQACYQYDNDEIAKTPPGDEGQLKLPNRFRALSLAQWANCLARQNKFGEAIAKYDQALNHNHKIDGMAEINKPVIYVNMGKCHLDDQQFEKGAEVLNSVVKSENLPIGYRRYAVQILFEDWSPHVDWETVRGAIHEHGDFLLNDTLAARFKRNPTFYFLANNAFELAEPQRALLWYSFIVPPNESEKALVDKLAEYNQIKAQIKDSEKMALTDASIAKIKGNIKKERAKLGELLPGVGSAHFGLRNFWAAYSTFRHLSDHYPKHGSRDDILYNCVHSAVQIEEWDESLNYGLVFLEEFPDHDLVPEVARLLCEIAFLKERFKNAYDISSEVREKMEAGSPERDIPDFVNGASLYQLGRYEQAEAELHDYIKHYPSGQRLEMARYFLGSTKVTLQKWEEANPLFDQWLSDYPDSELRAGALYQSGLCHVILDELKTGAARVGELQKRYPEANEIPASWNLKGDIMLGLGESTYEELVEVFSTARDLAYDKGPDQNEVAAYSHLQLINANNDVENWEEAGKHYDSFQEKYADSLWKLDVSVGSLKALVENERVEDAHDRIVQFINELSEDAASADLNQMFGTYIGFLDDNYRQPERLRRLAEFPAVKNPHVPEPLTALLLMAQVEEKESIEDLAKRPSQKDINSHYYQIDLDIPLENIPNYVLVRLGRWNRDVVNKKVRAREIYDYVISNRPEGGFVENALLDKAEMDLASGSEETYDAGLLTFQRLLNEFAQDPKLQERATLGLARILTEQENFGDALDYWERYLDGSGWNLARPEANFRYAECLDRLGKTAEAVKVYVSVYANFAGHIDYSTKAYLRTAEILHGRGKKKEALQVLQDMLRRMGHLEHSNVNKAVTLFETYKDDYLVSQK